MKLISKCAPTITTTLAVLIGPHALADPVPLAQYLSSVDRSEITFSGRIRYNSSDRDFTFYNEDREPFGVTMDTGRDIREKVETECAGTGFMFSFS